jgi:predicted dehydrogenase
MRFGAGAATAASRGSALETAKAVGTRAHINWFGVTLASFERGDLRQSPNGLYIYDDNGRREVPVEGGRGVGTLEMQEMHDAIFANAPIIHDGRWATATLEVALAIVQSGRERREVMLSRQCALPGVLA